MVSLREHVLESLIKEGRWQQFDISLPLGKVSQFVEELQASLSELENVRQHVIGHLGDGDLHLSVQAENSADIAKLVYDQTPRCSRNCSNGSRRTKKSLR
ncbi:FAD-linked oxidase C-terminal domain-containing protein [Paracoccus halophilus]|nr:FAD-linked oxidase C-terminal domain-containing protein [Paracoccus halophilus]